MFAPGEPRPADWLARRAGDDAGALRVDVAQDVADRGVATARRAASSGQRLRVGMQGTISTVLVGRRIANRRPRRQRIAVEEAGASHPRRRKDVSLQVLSILLAGHAFHERAEHHVAGVRVARFVPGSKSSGSLTNCLT